MEPKTIDILFDITSDRRSGLSIYYKRIRTDDSSKKPDPDPTDSDSETSDSEDEKYENYFKISFTLPATKYGIYTVNFFPESSVIYSKDCDTEEECRKISNKIFSQLHDSLPFVVTGQNSAYVDKGDYPDIPDEIKNMPDIPIANTIADTDDCYFMVALDAKGRIIFKEPLQPIW